MILNNIPEGEIVLLDTNIIIYSIRDRSHQCKDLMKRCAEREVFGVITSHVVAEIMHRLMMAEAGENGWIIKSNPAKQLAEKPEKVKLLFRYEKAIRNILTIGLRFEPVNKEDFIAAMSIQRETGLLTNDALLIAVAERLRIKAIVSADKKFEKLRDVVLYSPDDVNKS